MGTNLIGAIQELLGEAATPDIIEAWTLAYEFLADILIAQEADLYTRQQQQHGWQDFAPFRVVRKEQESEVIQSFYLEPLNNGMPSPADPPFQAKHQPGQFLTLRIPTNDGSTTMRNYSISVPTGQPHYRISVKHEAALHDQAPHGIVSDYLHKQVGVGDTIDVGPPCGNFVLDEQAAQHRPLVLLSAGVGITPILSMLHTAVLRDSTEPIYFIHAARNGQVHAFADEVAQLAQRHPRVHTYTCYDQPTEADQVHGRFDHTGQVTLPLLQRTLPSADADFYFCGPKIFMRNVKQALTDWGVEPKRIRFEWFGPAEDLDKTNTGMCPV